MSTRSNVQFLGYGGKTVANIYIHSDGYPEYAVPRIYRFLNSVKNQCAKSNYGFRFDDANYLAAKFVVFLAVYEFGQYDDSPGFLGFGSVGIADEDAGDGEYTYYVDCRQGKEDENGFPIVTGKGYDGVIDIPQYRNKVQEKPVAHEKPAKYDFGFQSTTKKKKTTKKKVAVNQNA